MEEKNYCIKIYGYHYTDGITLEQAKEWYRGLQAVEPRVTRRNRIIYKY